MLIGNDFDPTQFDTNTNKSYYLGEEILKYYKNEYDHKYMLTKGLNRYYLYKKAIFGNSYYVVAETKPKINEYIIKNNLKEID